MILNNHANVKKFAYINRVPNFSLFPFFLWGGGVRRVGDGGVQVEGLEDGGGPGDGGSRGSWSAGSKGGGGSRGSWSAGSKGGGVPGGYGVQEAVGLRDSGVQGLKVVGPGVQGLKVVGSRSAGSKGGGGLGVVGIGV